MPVISNRVAAMFAATLLGIGALGCDDASSTREEPFPVVPGGGSNAPLSDSGVLGRADAGTVAAPQADAGKPGVSPPGVVPSADAAAPVGTRDAGPGGPNQAEAGAPVDSGATLDAASEAGSPPSSGGSILPPVDSVDADGPFQTAIDKGNDYWVFRPSDLGQNGLKHPIFVWGTGATAVPEQYTDHFTRMASHGFVIVAPTPAFLTASNMKNALDWILQENGRSGSPYYQKLDPDRVAMGGHSQGSTSTFDAEAMESRLKTTLHIAGGSMDGNGSSKVKTPTAYICGETDIALENCKRDFMRVKDQPTFFSELKGVDHVACARKALPGMIAWLRWHLAGEVERKADFTGPNGMFFQGMWGSQTKNWD